GSPWWSPDGQWITFDSYSNGKPDIFVISAAGGPPRNLTNHPLVDAVPTWSVDGKWIFFASDRNGAFQVWRMPAAGGEAIPITKEGGFRAIQSIDGRHLYYSKRESNPNSLWRIGIAGDAPTQIADSLNNFSAFTVARRGVYFIPAPKDGLEAELRLIQA